MCSYGTKANGDIQPKFNQVNTLSGIQTNLFLHEQAGLLKQYDWGPRPKLRGPGFSRKLNSLPCTGFTHK